MITVGSLFTGTGALCELATAPLLGGHVAWHVDVDPAATALLTHHWPDTPNLGDIATIDWSAMEPVDVLTAGYPCQPFSAAGKRRGVDDDRYLWPEVARTIRVLQPRLVVLENVPGHVVRGFPEVVGELATLGFDTEWTCLRASDVGAPHRRERLFVVACPSGTDTAAFGCWASWRDNGLRATGLVPDTPVADTAGQGRGRIQSQLVRTDGSEAVRPGQAEPGRRDSTSTDPNNGRRGGGPEHHSPQVRAEGHHKRCRVDSGGRFLGWGPYALAIRRWESILGRPAPTPTVRGQRGGQQLNPVFVEWLIGLPEGHVTSVPGLSRNDMLRLLGNGVVPQQADAALRWLLPLLAEGRGAA